MTAPDQSVPAGELDEILRVLQALVEVDSTSARSNLPVLEVIEAQLDRFGVPHQRVVNADGTKANLLASIGPEVAGGVVVTGHTDCVPVTGQPWTVDPFTLTLDAGRVYGRGTTDMKGFLAVVLAALPAFKAAPLVRPLVLALTYDEELGTLGAPSLVDHLVATRPRPSAVIVGEPTSMELITAHKGVRAFTTTVEGLDGHSSQPHLAANALVAAARIVTAIDDLATEHRSAAADPRFDPPYTTFNAATLSSGQAINIVPRHATLTWEYRPVPADDSDAIARQIDRVATEEVLPALREATGAGSITTRSMASARALADEPGGDAVALVRRLTAASGPGRAVSFATDGGHFQAAGLSTVVCGPGAIEQAHIPDEYIELSQLDACRRMIASLVDELCRPLETGDA